jgi:signal transduction histidine kinase
LATVDPATEGQSLESRVAARFEKSIDESRENLARWLCYIRLFATGFFSLWFLISHRWLHAVGWAGSAVVIEVYFCVCLIAWYVSRRSRRFALCFGYLGPLLDVSVTTLSIAQLIGSAPHADRIVASNLISFALIVIASQWWYSYRLLGVTAAAAFAAQMYLQARVGFDAVATVNDLVLLLIASAVGAMILRNSVRLKLRAAREVELELIAHGQREALRSLENQALLAERLATLGTLVAGVAHDLNSPLTAIQSGTHWLQRNARGITEPDLPEVIEDMTTATTQLKTILHDLRALSHKDTEELRALDLDQVAERSLRLVMPQLRDKARVVREIGPAPRVLANETRLAQVLMNLLVNAAQAIPEGNAAQNRITVRIGSTPSGEALIEISDTGDGISPAVQERLFEPFFTTKPDGIGTGLGLAICKRILSSLNGTITLDRSRPGAGATFRVTLPPAPVSPTGVPFPMGRL